MSHHGFAKIPTSLFWCSASKFWCLFIQRRLGIKMPSLWLLWLLIASEVWRSGTQRWIVCSSDPRILCVWIHIANIICVCAVYQVLIWYRWHELSARVYGRSRKPGLAFCPGSVIEAGVWAGEWGGVAHPCKVDHLENPLNTVLLFAGGCPRKSQ